MNDYCLNKSWGLKGRQHTSTHLFHWVSLLQNKLSFTPGYYFIFHFCKIIMVYYLSQKQTNISFYMYALVTPEISHEIEGAVPLEDSDNQIPSSQGGGGDVEAIILTDTLHLLGLQDMPFVFVQSKLRH